MEYFADGADVIFVNNSHFVDATEAEGSMVAFGNTDKGDFVKAEHALMIHC